MVGLVFFGAIPCPPAVSARAKQQSSKAESSKAPRRRGRRHTAGRGGNGHRPPSPCTASWVLKKEERVRGDPVQAAGEGADCGPIDCGRGASCNKQGGTTAPGRFHVTASQDDFMLVL